MAILSRRVVTQAPNPLTPPHPHTPPRSVPHLLLLSLLFNLPFVLFRVHRLAFDTYSHLFFADHYRLRWWSLWEPRWYLGFSVASYPPLIHQLIALFSWPLSAIIAFFSPEPEPYGGAFRVLGEEIAFVIVLLIVLALFPLAVRAFARIFVGPRAAALAGLLAIFLPALSLTAWAFGQLPTLAATSVVLVALARGHDFVRTGRWLYLAQAVSLAGVAGVMHHAVFLFVPFVGLAVVLRGARSAGGYAIWSRRRAARLLLWAALSAIVVAAVLWPFLLWSRGQGLQTPIDHASRHNFFADGWASWFFFWPMYGPLLLIIPAAIGLSLRRRRLWPLLGLALFLFLLGLGGTTSLPRWLFGSGWEWLTYDRFSFWAATTLLPFAGVLMLNPHPPAPSPDRAVCGQERGVGGVRLVFLAALIGWASFSGWLAVIAHSQPNPVDLAPLVRFLQQPPQSRYRYLALGFGDQFARLSTLTNNGTLDGAYHTARELPELRASGIGALDAALWSKPGVRAVTPFLAHPERYGLRWVFVNHPAYLPILEATGWRFRWRSGSVTAWDYPGVTPVPVREPDVPRRSLAAWWWGSAPISLLIIALLMLAMERRPWAVARADVIRWVTKLRAGSLALLVPLLTLWWEHVLHVEASPVYFTYRSVLVFASDLAVALTLGLWIVERALRRERLRFGPRSLGWAGLGLIGACGLSALTSEARALSLAFTIHLLLLGGLYLLCVNDPPAPDHIGWTFAGAIVLQAMVTLVQVYHQGSPGMQYLPWPGVLTLTTPGVSVVENAEGVRWFRAYGTLPHPNILGGMLLIYLGGVVERFLTTGRVRWLAPIGLGVMTGALTFSRSAWLGAGAMLIGGVMLLPRASWSRARWALLVGLAAAFLTLWPLRSFVVVRAGVGTGSGVASIDTEQRSLNERALLIGRSLDLIRERPALGVGAGVFAIAVAARPELHVPFEPVHNLILLITTETGLVGALALAAWGGAVGLRLWQRRRSVSQAEAVWAVVLIGVLAVAMLDHYWWTLAPARTLAVLAFGLWVGAGHQPGVTPPRPGK